jgi:DNA-binding MarR family transcriptional regulator
MSGAVSGAAALRAALRDHVLAANRHQARVAQALDLHGSELAALDHLAARGPLAPHELRELLGLSSGGVTMLGQRLERLGYLERRPHPSDGRSHVVRLTPRAAELLEARLGPLAAELDAVLAVLGAAERARLAGVLAEATAVVERAAQAAASASWASVASAPIASATGA